MIQKSLLAVILPDNHFTLSNDGVDDEDDSPKEGVIDVEPEDDDGLLELDGLLSDEKGGVGVVIPGEEGLLRLPIGEGLLILEGDVLGEDPVLKKLLKREVAG